MHRETIAGDDELQELYIKLLCFHPIISLLHSPTKVFEELCSQKIEAVRNDPEKLRREIRSSPVFLQQARTLLKQVLLKTSYKELRRVEAALNNGIQKLSGNNAYMSKQLQGINVAFTGIRLELQLAAGENIQYLQPIPTNNQSEGGEDEEGNDSDSKHDDVDSLSVLKEQLFFTVSELQQKDKLEEFLARRGIKEKQVWTYEGFTILHDAAMSSNPNWAVELITRVMKFIEENEDFPWTTQEFLDEQIRDDGCTALHLAVLRGAIPVVKCLIDHGANILINDDEGFTPLDRMYEEMPEALLYILSQSGVISYGSLKQKNVIVRLDFGSFIDRLRPDEENVVGAPDDERGNDEDCGQKNADNNGDPSHVVAMEMAAMNEDSTPGNELESPFELKPEMDRLAHTIYRCFETTAPQLLSHIVVKIFLELKWNKLKGPIYFLTLFYIALYMSYTCIAIYVFIVRFPYADENDNTTDKGDAEGVNSTVQQTSAVGLDPAAFISFAIAMVLYVGLEIYQYYLILSLSARSGWEAFVFYLRDLENVLQLLFMLGAFAIMGALLGGREKSVEQHWTYWIAAYSVVIAWILILLQLGNFYGLGKYVHMFQTVFTRFATVMALYLCFLIGFNIACGIVFPQTKEFSYPRSFFRSFAMLTGELNFDEVFNPEESRPFELAALTIYLGSIIIVTIVVGNLLIGLTVDDVANIFKEADAIHRIIQVERLYILERLLFSLRIPWDMFVVPREGRIDGAVVFTETGRFSRPLQRELRCLLANPQEYKRQYLQFD